MHFAVPLPTIHFPPDCSQLFAPDFSDRSEKSPVIPLLESLFVDKLANPPRINKANIDNTTNSILKFFI